MKNVIKLTTAVVGLLLTGIAVYLVTPIAISYMHESRETAFLQAKWGMTPERVQSALGFAISENNGEEFFDIMKNLYPTVAKNRYKNFGLISPDFRLWKRHTAVYFTFFDNQLFEYKAEIDLIKANDLHTEIMNHLVAQYGQPINTDSLRGKDFLHDADWTSSTVRLSYWLVREKLPHDNNRTQYVARVRSLYLPLRNKIDAEAAKERDQLFGPGNRTRLQTTVRVAPHNPLATGTPDSPERNHAESLPVSGTADGQARVVDLQEAIRSNLVEVTARGMGGSSGDVVELRLRRLCGEILRIIAQPGTVLTPKRTTTQRMVIRLLKGLRTGEHSYTPSVHVDLADDEPHTAIAEAYCLDFDKDNPSQTDEFDVHDQTSTNSAALFRVADKFGSNPRAIQAALWLNQGHISVAEIHERFPLNESEIEDAQGILHDQHSQ